MKTLLTAVAVGGCAFGVSAQLVTDFESYANGDSVMFRAPGYSGSTSSQLDTSTFNFSGVTNVFPAGNANAGLNVFNTIFTFKTDLATPWVRLTSNASPNLPNPAVSFTSGLSFDIYTDRPIYVALLLRETNTTEPIGGNAGTSGGIEFVGGVPNSTTVSKGQLVPANTWTTIWFNVPESSVAAFAGTTANGILESTTGKGALEALGFSVDANTSGTFNIYMDNFQVIPEPSTAALVGLGALAFLARRRQNA
jgi:hypothetical protein